MNELHVWQLNQEKSIASAHLVIDGGSQADFHRIVNTASDCFYGYGIHHVTLQPKTVVVNEEDVSIASVDGVGSWNEWK